MVSCLQREPSVLRRLGAGRLCCLRRQNTCIVGGNIVDKPPSSFQRIYSTGDVPFDICRKGYWRAERVRRIPRWCRTCYWATRQRSRSSSTPPRFLPHCCYRGQLSVTSEAVSCGEHYPDLLPHSRHHHSCVSSSLPLLLSQSLSPAAAAPAAAPAPAAGCLETFLCDRAWSPFSASFWPSFRLDPHLSQNCKRRPQ